jgi:hypothetical protein
MLKCEGQEKGGEKDKDSDVGELEMTDDMSECDGGTTEDIIDKLPKELDEKSAKLACDWLEEVCVICQFSLWKILHLLIYYRLSVFNTKVY